MIFEDLNAVCLKEPCRVEMQCTAVIRTVLLDNCIILEPYFENFYSERIKAGVAS